VGCLAARRRRCWRGVGEHGLAHPLVLDREVGAAERRGGRAERQQRRQVGRKHAHPSRHATRRHSRCDPPRRWQRPQHALSSSHSRSPRSARAVVSWKRGRSAGVPRWPSGRTCCVDRSNGGPLRGFITVPRPPCPCVETDCLRRQSVKDSPESGEWAHGS
jgi:hypothetical protein